MRDTNNVNIIGRLAKDAKVQLLPNGTAIGNFAIASNSSKKTSEGWQDITNFFDVTFFGSMAKNLQQYLLKGKQVAVSGELRQDRWEGNDGKKYYSVYILATNVQLLGGNGNKSQTNTEQIPQQASAQPIQQVNTQQQQNTVPPQVQQMNDMFNGDGSIIY